MAFLSGSKKTTGGREGFSEKTNDPQPMHILRARPMGPEVSESESEWDGQTCCSVGTSITGKAGSVSSIKSKGMSNVAAAKGKINGVDGGSSVHEVKSDGSSVNEVKMNGGTSMSEVNTKTANMSEESPALCLLKREFFSIRNAFCVLLRSVDDSGDACAAKESQVRVCCLIFRLCGWFGLETAVS